MRVHAPGLAQKSNKEAGTGFLPLSSCLIDPVREP